MMSSQTTTVVGSQEEQPPQNPDVPWRMQLPGSPSDFEKA